MASKNNILEITTPGFTRIVDVNTADYTHYTKKKSDKSDQPSMMAEIAYPQGKIVMTRSEKNHHIIIQNTAFSSSSKTKKRKRALVQVEVGGAQDRFFEDGTILHGGESSIGAMCKVALVKKDDGGQEVNVCFTSFIPPPMPPPQTIPEDGASHSRKDEKGDNSEKDSSSDENTNAGQWSRIM